MPRVSTEQMIDAVQKTHGLLGLAAWMLGISRRTLWRRIKESADLQEAVDEVRQYTAGVAESSLSRVVQSGEAEELCYYLRRQCKDGGRAFSGAVDQRAETQIEQPITEEARLAEAQEILELARVREAHALTAKSATGGQDTAVHPPADADEGESPQP